MLNQRADQSGGATTYTTKLSLIDFGAVMIVDA